MKFNLRFSVFWIVCKKSAPCIFAETKTVTVNSFFQLNVSPLETVFCRSLALSYARADQTKNRIITKMAIKKNKSNF
jgi:hypothetical protein